MTDNMTDYQSFVNPDDEHAREMMAFILRLRRHGLTDQKVLNAVSTLPRPVFVLPEFGEFAWRDLSLPIQCGQTITPPVLAATIAERLDVEPLHRVLEIGTGSGYLTAVLGRLAKRVLTLDRWRTLVTEAEERLRAVTILNVTMMVADGSSGWRQQAPFDRIVTTAAMSEVPEDLLDQLALGGRMIAPIGPPGEEQQLTMIARDADGFHHTPLMDIRAASMILGVADRL
ncbi:protein-L-isoaspartate(D-aspartate) O-methyltransferase [Labrys sp. KNU-23]|uniref:protein-L-isoaspartate(D-aspartate) O-methyltransferase n=1 Tax=Labrys sp. KNU-23 TaxID=2789216 RepID=UPI0011F07EA2|nr:protein-L-isoaspartate(D-aspartate) O-methyltransferase [Labrys sp. KNU-23]QEN86647.1 protein-L-isoaspartate(D-aspartate) O-methyltransferase [Labrys sp. KNU-23]